MKQVTQSRSTSPVPKALQFVDARITIEAIAPDGFPVVIEGPGGEATEVTIPLIAIERFNALNSELEELLNEYAHTLSDDAATQAKTCLETLGAYLFRDLEGSRRWISSALGISTLSQNEILRLQIRIRDMQSEGWPWEILCDQSNTSTETTSTSHFVALSPSVAISRYQERFEQIPRREQLDTLRVLVITASPLDSASLDAHIAKQLDAIMVLQEAEARLEIRVHEHATRDALMHQMPHVDKPFHVVHFIGHGYIKSLNTGAAESGVILEQEDGSSDKVPADEFARILIESQEALGSKNRKEDTGNDTFYPCLVILDACHSAQMTVASVTRALIDRVPAVIGMRFQITSEFVLFFNGLLYMQLLDGHPIDQAVATCRRAAYSMFNQPVDQTIPVIRHIEWSIPILYLRAMNGELFAFNPDSHLSDRWLAQLKLISALSGEHAKEAMKALLQLGTSAVALSVFAMLAFPLAAVRGAAAMLLRSLPHSPEAHNSLVRLIAPVLASEPEAAVRRELARVVAQPRISSNASAILENMLGDSDAEVQAIARAGLSIHQVLAVHRSEAEVFALLSKVLFPTLGDELRQLFNDIRGQFDQIRHELQILTTQITIILKGGNEYAVYLEQVETARRTAITLREHLATAKQMSESPAGAHMEGSLTQEMAAWIGDANKAVAAAEQAGVAVTSLVSALMEALDEVVNTLALERDRMNELDSVIRALDGFVLANTAWTSALEIVVRDIEG